MNYKWQIHGNQQYKRKNLRKESMLEVFEPYAPNPHVHPWSQNVTLLKIGTLQIYLS